MDQTQDQVPDYDKMRKRVRGETKYKALSSMALKLLQIYGLTQFYTNLLTQCNIKPKRNMEHIVLAMLVLHWKLIKNEKYSKAQAVKCIFDYFKNNLQDEIHKPYKNNHPDFIMMVKAKNQLDINVFWRIFNSDMNNGAQVLELLKQMYEVLPSGKYEHHQLSSMNKLKNLILQYGNKHIHSQNKQPGSTSLELFYNGVDLTLFVIDE